MKIARTCLAALSLVCFVAVASPARAASSSASDERVEAARELVKSQSRCVKIGGKVYC